MLLFCSFVIPGNREKFSLVIPALPILICMIGVGQESYFLNQNMLIEWGKHFVLPL